MHTQLQPPLPPSPPPHLLIHSLPNSPFLASLQSAWFKSCVSGCRGWSTKALLTLPGDQRGLRPILDRRAHTDRVSPPFLSLPFPCRIKPLGFWMVRTIFFTHPKPTPNRILKGQVKRSVGPSAHELALLNVHSRTLADAAVDGAHRSLASLQSPHSNKRTPNKV